MKWEQRVPVVNEGQSDDVLDEACGRMLRAAIEGFGVPKIRGIVNASATAIRPAANGIEEAAEKSAMAKPLGGLPTRTTTHE